MADTIRFDPAAARDYLEEMEQLKRSADIRRENNLSAVSYAQRSYDSLWDSLRIREDRACQKLEELQSASSDEEEGEQTEIFQAQQELNEAQMARCRLERLWEELYPGVRQLQIRMEEHYDDFVRHKQNGDLELQRYDETLRQFREVVRGEEVPSSGERGALIGWCPGANWFSAVTAQPDGSKSAFVTIGGKRQSFSCDRSGFAKAYRTAWRSGDRDMMARTSAMFEVETFRESLELGMGDPNIPQLGGYHGNVSKQDPKGYESHHIPSDASQDRHKNWLPALSLTREDHRLTASHGRKQFRTYCSVFSYDRKVIKGANTLDKKWENNRKSRRQEADFYVNEVIRQIRIGEIGWIQIMKSEILELKAAFGDKYDGAISAYLDAVLDMLATRGIPAAVPLKQK